MSFAVKAIKSVGSWVDDELFQPLKEVGSWVDDEIFQPVIKMAEAQIQDIIDDPVKALLEVAIIMAPVDPATKVHLMATLEAADTYEEGGSLGDALKSAATVYVASEMGEVVGDKAGKFGEGVGDVFGDGAVGSFVTEAVTEGTTNAISAVVTGQDPLEAFISGGVNAGVGRILGEVNDRTDNALDKLEELGGFREDDPNTQGNEAQSVGKVVRSMVQQGVSDMLVTGEINERRMAGIISSAVVTTKVVSDLVGEYVSSDNTIFNTRMITASVQNALNVAMTEGDVSEAFMTSLARQVGMGARKAVSDGTFKENFSEVWDRTTGKLSALDVQGREVERIVGEHSGAVEELNEISQKIEAGSVELNRLQDKKNSILTSSDGRARMSSDQLARLNAAEKAATDYNEKFIKLVTDEYGPRITELNAVYDSTAADYQTALDAYGVSFDELTETQQELNTALKPQFNDINKATVNNLSPDFDAEFYAKQNDITEEQAHNHFLTTGLYNNSPANQEALTTQTNIKAGTALAKIATATRGKLDLTKLSPEQNKTVLAKLEKLAADTGVTVEELDAAAVAQTALSALNNPDGKGDEYFSATTDSDGNVTDIKYGYDSKGFGLAKGTTNKDVLSGKAKQTYNAETGKYEWANPSTEAYVADDALYAFDPTTGQAYGYDEAGERYDLTPIEVNNASPNTGPTLQDLSDPDNISYSPEAFTANVSPYITIGDDGIPSSTTFGFTQGEPIPNWFLASLQDGATYLKDKGASEFAQNAYANAIRATGGIIEGFNGFAVLFGVDPAGTAAGEFAADMQALGENANTEGYKVAAENMREFQKNLQTQDDPNTPIVYDDNGEYVSGDESKKSLFQGMQGVFKTAANHPAAFFGEYVSVEFMQEAAPLLIGGLASIGAKFVAKTLSKELTQELAEKSAIAIGRKAGLTAAAVTDVSESWSATAGGAYEEAHATFTKMANKEADILELSGVARTTFLSTKQEEAKEYALGVAINSGNVAAIATIAALAVGGMSADKLFIGGIPKPEFTNSGMFNEIARRISEGATVAVKEGATESFEEGIATGYTQSQLALIDPDVDVMGNIGTAAAMGLIIGSSVAIGAVGVVNTGDMVSNIAIASNPAALEIFANGENYSQVALKSALGSAGLDSTAVTDAMNTLYNDVYTSSAEATKAMEGRGLDYTQDDVLALIGNTGAGSDVDEELATYWALTYGSSTDTDGDGIPNAVDDNNTSPSTNPSSEPTPEEIAKARAEARAEANKQAAENRAKREAAAQAEADRLTAEAEAASTQAEADRLAAEAAAAQAEADRLAAEASAQAEADRLAAEAAAKAEADRLAAEAAAKAEADRLAQAEADRLAQIEADRLAAEKEAARLAEEARLAQEEADRLVEEARLADVADREAAQEAARLAAAEAARLAEAAAVARDAIATGDRDAIKGDVAGVKDDVAGVKTKLGDVEASILAEMKKNEAAGMGRDEALAKAIDDVSGELGTTKDSLLAEIGTTEETLRNEFESGIADVKTDIADVKTELGDVEASILAEVEKNEAAGMDRDEALSTAIDDVSGELGKTKDELLAEIGTTEETLRNEFESGIADVSDEVQIVADFVGKPAQEVTDADITFVAKIIAEQEVLADPSSFVPTDQQLQYDVNNDGVIDINDQNMLEQSFGGQEVTLQGDMFNPTGLYKQNADIAAQQQADALTQFELEQELEQQQQLDIQTQINTNQKFNMFDQEARRIAEVSAAQPTQATTQQMGLANIGPAYNFNSVFRNEAQDQFYSTPFGGYSAGAFGVNKAKGGKIENDTDRLIRLIGEG